MKKILFLILLLLVIGCGDELKVKSSEFATMQNNSLVPHSNTYNLSDTVYLVLEKVGPLQKDEDNKVKIEMDLSVVDLNNTILLNKTNMLGKNGQIMINESYLEFPYVNVDTKTLVKGKYTLFVTIKDLIGNQTISKSATFNLQ